MRRRGEKRTAGVVGNRPAAVIAFAELWTYRQARRRGKGQDVWVWTAVVREPDGSRWANFELGDRSAETFLRRYERLPEAELYRTDGYRVYGWRLANRHQVGKGGVVNWNEGLRSWRRGKLNRLYRRTKGARKAWVRWGVHWLCCWRAGPRNLMQVYVENTVKLESLETMAAVS